MSIKVERVCLNCKFMFARSDRGIKCCENPLIETADKLYMAQWKRLEVE